MVSKQIPTRWRDGCNEGNRSQADCKNGLSHRQMTKSTTPKSIKSANAAAAHLKNSTPPG